MKKKLILYIILLYIFNNAHLIGSNFNSNKSSEWTMSPQNKWIGSGACIGSLLTGFLIRFKYRNTKNIWKCFNPNDPSTHLIFLSAIIGIVGTKNFLNNFLYENKTLLKQINAENE